MSTTFFGINEKNCLPFFGRRSRFIQRRTRDTQHTADPSRNRGQSFPPLPMCSTHQSAIRRTCLPHPILSILPSTFSSFSFLFLRTVAEGSEPFCVVGSEKLNQFHQFLAVLFVVLSVLIPVSHLRCPPLLYYSHYSTFDSTCQYFLNKKFFRQRG